MTTYRVGNHHGVTIISEGNGARCGRPDHDCERGHLAAVVIDGGSEGDQALAERICALLNADETAPAPCQEETYSWHHFTPEQVDAYWIRCTLLGSHDEHHDENTGLTWRSLGPVTADSCTCTIVGPHPDCPVHHGRRARGPKPPPVGPGCICDGSGRTCPRHGAVT